MQNNSALRGNVLLYILIAVALFAALAFALTQSRGGATSTLSKEKARLIADEMIEYGNSLRVVADKMMLLSGVSDINDNSTGILFSATGAHAAYGVVGAQPTTELFNQSGGKVSYQAPPEGACLSACAYEFSGQYTVTGVGDDASSELVMLVIDVDPTVCEILNSTLSLGWSTIPTGDTLTLTRFSGTNYGDNGGANPITLTGGANEFVNKRAFCYQEVGGGERYVYLHVIRSR